jgi:hypothetical protein
MFGEIFGLNPFAVFWLTPTQPLILISFLHSLIFTHLFKVRQSLPFDGTANKQCLLQEREAIASLAKG